MVRRYHGELRAQHQPAIEALNRHIEQAGSRTDATEGTDRAQTRLSTRELGHPPAGTIYADMESQNRLARDMIKYREAQRALNQHIDRGSTVTENEARADVPRKIDNFER